MSAVIQIVRFLVSHTDHEKLFCMWVCHEYVGYKGKQRMEVDRMQRV